MDKEIERLKLAIAILQCQLEIARLRRIDNLIAKVEAEGITYNGKVIMPPKHI